MRVKVKTKLKVQGTEISHEVYGILVNQTLRFLEDDVKVYLDFENHFMVRDDLIKKLSYKFLENEETLNEVFLHHERISVGLNIFTKKFLYHRSSCKIVYVLIDEQKEVSYQICWEEVE